MINFFITGDTHGDFYRIFEFAKKFNTTIEDVLVILGDTGINFYLSMNDYILKERLKKLPLTLFCIKGNHEKYPENLPSYKIMNWHGGHVFYEEEYPNILFAKDGDIYDFNGKSVLVIGGAYSIDKEYRLRTGNGWSWFEDEQPSDELKAYVNELIKTKNHFDYVFTHTCPINVEPRHLFMSGVDQSKVDKSTENWLQYVADNITFEKWYFGHFHGDWVNGKYHMLFNGYDELT